MSNGIKETEEIYERGGLDPKLILTLFKTKEKKYLYNDDLRELTEHLRDASREKSTVIRKKRNASDCP